VQFSREEERKVKDNNKKIRHRCRTITPTLSPVIPKNRGCHNNSNNIIEAGARGLRGVTHAIKLPFSQLNNNNKASMKIQKKRP
jgi:hypothetical protein